MKTTSLALVSSLLIVTGILGVGVGYYLTPEYKLSMYEKTSMDFGRADRLVDLRYINAMIMHHRGAMLLAEQAFVKTERKEIKDLSSDILKNEPGAIAELYEWKKEWYKDTRLVKDPVVANLGGADDKFDLRFLNALIVHHEDGLIMTRSIKSKSSRTEILDNADAVDVFLTTTLKVFKDWRMEWYKI